MAYDDAELARYQTLKKGIAMGKSIQNEDLQFDLPRFVTLSEQDKYNLLMLRSLKRIKWYVKTAEKCGGQVFGEEAITWDPN